MLQGHWHLQIFSDGQDAINRLPNLGADLILLDIGLPNLDGISLYKMLRGHGNTRNTPIIVITGSQDWELHRMGLQTGILLRKPFNMEQLLFMIHALYQRMRKRTEGSDMPRWATDVTDLVGHTPLVELKRVTAGVHATVLAKLEMF